MKKFFLLILTLLLVACNRQIVDDTEDVDDVIDTETEVVEESEDVEAPSEELGIRVTDPQPNTTVSFPLVVKGEAKGQWYFEASFSLTLVDDEGKVLVQTFVQAQDNWMQPDFVAFEGTITSADIGDATSGKLIFSKANASGLPEYDLSVEVPVKF